MPKKKKGHESQFREFYFLDRDKVDHNYMKYLRDVIKYSREKDVMLTHMQILLFAYDLEFFTARYIMKYTGWTHGSTMNAIWGMARSKLIYTYIGQKTMRYSREDYFFRDETKTNYRSRYALTEKGRNFVRDIYLIANQGHR